MGTSNIILGVTLQWTSIPSGGGGGGGSSNIRLVKTLPIFTQIETDLSLTY